MIETGLWVLGVACLGFVLLASLRAGAAQEKAEEIVPRSTRGLPTKPNGVASVPSVIARLEIEGVLSVPVLETISTDALLKGVGHVPGTALPGGLGNLVLAGHRDTFFRPLRHIQDGMTISVVSRSGKFRYIVDSSEVVAPEKIEVTSMGERPEMTLITCYPFDFVGAAPKRFIVHTHLLSLEPD